MLGHPEAGASLVETLVVLMLVAVVVSASTATLFSDDPARTGRAEALRLADRLDRAGDRALLTGETVLLRADPKGYAFHASDQTVLHQHTLPNGVRLGPDMPGDFRIQPDGAGRAQVWVVRAGETAWQVSFDGLAARVAVRP